MDVLPHFRQLLLAFTALAACGDSRPTLPADSAIVGPPVAVRVAAAGPATSLGDTLRYATSVVDALERFVTTPLDWTVEDQTIARSLGDGRFVAIGPGSTAVAARVPNTSVFGRAPLVVSQVPVRIIVVAAADTVRVGGAFTVASWGLDARSNAAHGIPMTWTISGPVSCMRRNLNDYECGVAAPGQAVFQVTYQGLTATRMVVAR